MVSSEYVCMNCKKTVEIDLERVKKLICPYCGFRIFEKKRPSIPKRIIAR
ncbi:MAG TPA: DNA-directed RNA polymerase subunit P [Candidatus Aenigmarchaeota archaeon]|nr:MAG: DNA-directed RNA polymerase subunit P [Candidatus Aenigmarchaeota archaeon]HDD46135.1 DNA-directed RNA polymerase subunit P [Candidatus Aenigmarchaeota archaeon]